MKRFGVIRGYTSAVVMCLVLTCAAPLLAQSMDAPALAAAKADFASAMERPSIHASAYAPSGLVPEPVDLSHLRGAARTRTLLVLPAYFDLRLQGKLTPVRDQGNCGTCWDFAAFGSLESSLMPAQSYDFSENNLKNLSGFDIGCCSGGNRTMATAYFARWGGPVLETDDAYNTSNCYSPAGLPIAASVQDVSYIPDRSGPLDNTAIKTAVMTYGAIYTAYYHDNGYYNSNTKSYYYYGGSSPNHAVCIVGWDDSYAAGNFLTPPPGNGAFIIRNSWGSWWGQSGYFYISYYDANIGTENAAFEGNAAMPYESVYQYDPYGWISSGGYGSQTAWFANVFTAAADSSVAAASWYSASPNSSYTLRIFRDPTTSPSSGTLIASKIGVIAEAGYHTIPLDAPGQLLAGHKFSVVVQLTTPGYDYPIPLERPYSGYSSKASASPSQSYISSNGSTWSDAAGSFAGSNVCVKAFTINGGAPPPPPPPALPGTLAVSPEEGVVATGFVGGPFTPANAVFTLTNMGETNLAWTATRTATWLNLSKTMGTLAPGASTTLTATVNSNAARLLAGTHSNIVSFTNTTNGNGSTTRSVTLNVNPPLLAYVEQPEAFSWTMPDLPTTLMLADNAVSKAIRLPFAFHFYGRNYTSLYISSNGLISFASTGATQSANAAIPVKTTPNAAIYPYWDDLNPRTGGTIQHGTVGVAPNRVFVASWVGVPHKYSALTNFTFQALLYEGSNEIVFNYAGVSGADPLYSSGASATVGIENQTGTLGVQHSRNLFGAISDNCALRYVGHPQLSQP